MEHSNDKWVAFAWPQRIAQQCRDTEGLLKQSRGLFQEEVSGRGDAQVSGDNTFSRVLLPNEGYI